MKRFRVGQLVEATQDDGSTDWADNDAARNRPWGLLGIVKEVSDSHGICYEVITVAGNFWYNHGELKAGL